VGIELIGTPAEESGGGKIDLIDAGAFKQSVAVLSSHPGGNTWEFGRSSLGIVGRLVRFHGLASHAAYSPHKGKNALTAAIRLFLAVDGWRQHLPADTRIHGIITKGGAASNIIPDLAECDFGLRAADLAVLEEMDATFRRMAEGAAMQTGTTVEIDDKMRLSAPVKPNPPVGAHGHRREALARRRHPRPGDRRRRVRRRPDRVQRLVGREDRVTARRRPRWLDRRRRRRLSGRRCDLLRRRIDLRARSRDGCRFGALRA